ncbi:MAG: chondroitinase-B domain-containing protein [Reichenbachiella sp.]|uniref:chondroitinase-B domain-containing protein n=2 Tax=Reichenbachiella sp. TaxID=2184521 RepID=UPI003298A43B
MTFHFRLLAAMMIGLLADGVAYAQSTNFSVSTQAGFDDAMQNASAGDSIIWESGSYQDIFMDIDKDGVIVTAEKSGGVSVTGASKVEIPADDVTLSGIQFLSGDIGTDHVIQIDGSDVLVTQINIKDYTSYKYLIIDELSQRVIVSYSNFENRLNLDDQNILSILVDENTPGYHKVQYCSFKNFDGTGNDMGIEPIRIGVSTQAEYESRSIVEYCYFTNCDGDGELISNKAAQNVFRYNTFENNTKAELVLRHGDQGVVYGNFFINNMGGVRVREGQNHFIYNNYFEGLDKRSIYLQNEESDPLENIHIYFNTIVNSAAVLLGGEGSFEPKGVVFANNLFAQPTESLFEDATGNETWIANLTEGTLGITRPDGLTEVDLELETNSEGYLQIGSGSAAIDEGASEYPAIPTIEGLDIDEDILLDLMRQTRPTDAATKDVGAFEYSADGVVKPHVNESNTGPIYLSDQEFFTLSTTVVGSGEINLNPPSGFYASGTSVIATAVIVNGSQFTGWSGDLSGTTNPQTITIDGNMDITANFTEVLNIDNEINGKGWRIFPNPSQHKLNVDIRTNQASKIQLELLTITGQQTGIGLQDSFVVGDHSIQLDISDLSKGIYVVSIKQFGFDDRLIHSERQNLIKQ